MSSFFRLGLVLALFSLLSTSVHAKRYVNVPSSDVMVEMDRTERTNETEALDPSDINIFVWNLYKGLRPNWSRDYVKQVKDSDILLLQEIYLSPTMKKALAENKFHSYQFATTFMDTESNNTRTGVGIGSIVKPAASFFQRSTVFEPFAKTPKMILYNDFNLKGMVKKLRVCNTHAINFVGVRKFKKMLKQIRVGLQDFKGPIVLAGDFNTWSKKKLRILRKLTKSMGLKEVQFSNGNQRIELFGNIVDYIFVRGVDVLESNIHGHIHTSDHKPMSVRISIR